MANLYKKQKTVYYKYFNYPNVNIISNLTENDCILSGFSSDNYAMLPQPFNPGAETWEIQFKFKFYTLSDFCSIFYTSVRYDGMVIGLASSGVLEILVSSNGTSWNVAEAKKGTFVLSANKDYWVRVNFTGTQYILSYSEDGVDFIEDIVVDSTKTLYSNATGYLLGVNRSFAEPLTGEIDLKESYIKIGNTIWWQGHKQYCQRTTVDDYDFSKVQDVYCTIKESKNVYYKYGKTPNVLIQGNVNIEDGVASGFTSTNYLTIPKPFVPGSNPWEIVLKVKTSDLSATNNWIGATAAFKGGISVYCENKVLKCSISSNGTSWDIAKTKTGATLTGDTVYYIKAEFTGSQYLISYKTEDTDWTASISIVTETSIYQPVIWIIGAGHIGGDSFYTATGGIDFKACYININGERWWDGTRLEKCTAEDNYALSAEEDIYYGITYRTYMDKTFIGSGTHYITVEKEGDYLVEIVSGGGSGGYTDGGTDSYSDTSYSYHYYANGGTGAYFKGYIHLTKGQHVIKIGGNTITVGEYGASVKIDEQFEMSGGINGRCATPKWAEYVTATGGSLINTTNVSKILDYRVGTDRVLHGRWKDNNGKGFDNTPSVAPSRLSQYGYAGGRKSKVLQLGGQAYLNIKYKYGEIL